MQTNIFVFVCLASRAPRVESLQGVMRVRSRQTRDYLRGRAPSRARGSRAQVRPGVEFWRFHFFVSESLTIG